MNSNQQHRSISVCKVILLIVFLAMTLLLFISCAKAEPDSEAPVVSSSPIAEVSVSPTTTPDNSLNVSGAWAAAVKGRDGKAQYALMTKALQEKMHDQFEGLNWVTGTSSPWIESYTISEITKGIRVIFDEATATGPSGHYFQDLTFTTEEGVIKIASISTPQTGSPDEPFPAFSMLTKLLGKTKDELLSAVPEKPTAVDEGGLGFDQAGVRVWFDNQTYTKVSQVLIMSDQIDIGGAKIGDQYDVFKRIYGDPISDTNGDAHFAYNDIYLSVVRDTTTDKVISVYILSENF